MNYARILPLLMFAAGCASAPSSDPSPEASSPMAAQRQPSFVVPRNEIAWSSIRGSVPQLPAWARVYAETLPATTAHQINLDFAQRVRNPLGPVLSAELRWTTASALGCEYAKRCAELDLRRAGVPSERLRTLDDVAAAPEADRAAIEFARKLTVASSSITDAEFADLIEASGPDDVVAIVHTVAYANFQSRILLALGISSEANEDALLPQEVRPPAQGSLPVPARRTPSASVATPPGPASQPSWTDRTVAELRDLLDRQKAKTTRIPSPDDPARLARVPRPYRGRMGKIAWGTVSMGYQPQLTGAWFRTMDAFEEEAALDQVFASSVFWVVNRTTECFYCMGHTEMLMEVGGLSGDAVVARAARLADGDWRDFPPAEQHAFRFARKLTATPSAVTDNDIRALSDTFGRERTLDLIWQVAWGNYMMRISNAFQLRLESTNVFAEQKTPPKDAEGK